MAIRVFLYGLPAHTGAMRQMFGKTGDIVVVGETDSENKVLDSISRLNADVLLMYIDGSTSNYRVAEQVYMLRPQCLNFALSSKAVYERESLNISQNGIQYIYEDTLTDEQLIAYVKNAYTIERGRKMALNGGGTETAAKVLTFYSPKSGLGQTSFLTSLAVELTMKRRKVIVLDFDLQFGDLNTVLGIETKETLAELLQEQSSPTIDIVRQYVVYHKSGTSVLCAPRNAEYAEKIQSEQIEKIITALRPYYDYILIDTSSVFNDISFTCFEHSNSIFLVTKPDISLLKHTKKVISLLESLGQDEKIHLLLSDLGKNSRIGRDAVEKTLGHPVWHVVPRDEKSAVEAINQGEPLAALFPKSAVSRACADAADMILKAEDSGTVKADGAEKKGRRAGRK